MSDEQTRRTVLKAGTALGSLAVVGSLSGCSFLSGGDSTSYQTWLFEPGAVSDRNHYSFSVIDHDVLQSNEENLEDTYDAYESLEDSFPLEQMGVGYDSLDTTITVGDPGIVLLGEFSRDEAVSEFEDTDEFDTTDEYEGYTIVTDDDEDPSGVAGIADGTAVAARSSLLGPDDTELQEVVETLIDANAGEEDRYVVQENMGAVVDSLGSGTMIAGWTQEETEETNIQNGEFEGVVGSGVRITVNEDAANYRISLVFADSSDADTDDIEEWTDSDQFEEGFDLDDISISQNGRVVEVTGTGDTDEIASAFDLPTGNGDSETDDVAPNTFFAYDYSSQDGTVEVQVMGGDSFDSDQVRFAGDVAQDGDTWTEVRSGGSAEITAGETVTLDVTAGDEFLLQIEWSPGLGGTTSIIGTVTGPDREAP